MNPLKLQCALATAGLCAALSLQAEPLALSGWSHPQSDLAPVPAYQPYAPTVLIKKVGNWHQQHSTGVEAALKGHEAEVTLAFTVDWDNTQAPPSAQLQNAYGQHFSTEQLSEFSDPHFHLKVSIYQPAEVGQFRRDAWLRLTPDKTDYQWPIHLTALPCVLEVNYADSSAPHCPQTGWQQLVLVQEVAGNRVLRNLNPALFETDTQPEFYRRLTLTGLTAASK